MEKDCLKSDGLAPPVTVARPRKTNRLTKVAIYGVSLFTLYLLARNFQGREVLKLDLELKHSESESFDAHSWVLEAFGGGHGRAHGEDRTAAKEALFLSIPTPESALAASRAYATHPHLAASKEDFSDAKVILKLFQDEFSIPAAKDAPIFQAGTPESRNATLLVTERDSDTTPSAWIDTYYPVMNMPKEQGLSIISTEGQSVWDADLVEDQGPNDEDGNPWDKEAAEYRLAVPAWHGLSKDGEVTSSLVYVNYGTKEDYDELVAAGTNFTDKIVIARYGANFRGLKIALAESLGAAGVLIYSDPRDDGIVTVENGYAPYPVGPARNPSSVQRGSVQYLSLYPGDPTTPGIPAYENSTRVEGGNVPNIPSLPISWKNAQRLLEEIGGTDVTGKKIDIRTRPLDGTSSESKVRLVNRVDTKVMPIWNTMAAIPGHIRDEVVIVGCHRDAWVMGAADPTSGTVSLHEVVRAFGGLLKTGWKPLRTVVFASWDAEEYGLIGSTEFGEDFAGWLQKHAVSYLNVDVSVSGSPWHSSASPSLAHLIKKTALDVPHPTIPGKSLWDARGADGPYTGTNATSSFAGNEPIIDAGFAAAYEAEQIEIASSETGVGALGSGSDYTVFLQRLGIASVDQGFSSGRSDSVYHYHSIFDSERYQEVYADPGFFKHVAVAQNLGLLALRIVDAIILPLNTTQYAYELGQYLDKVESIDYKSYSADAAPLFSHLRTSIGKLQKASVELDEEKKDAEKDFLRLLRKIPGRKGHCRHCHGVLGRIARWIKGIFGVHEHKHPRHHQGHGHDHGHRRPHHQPPPHVIKEFIKAAKRVRATNQKLINFERGFISSGGLKDREWYKHLAVAPGKWLGYGATSLPGLTEALTIDKNITLAQFEAGRLVELLDKLTTDITIQ